MNNTINTKKHVTEEQKAYLVEFIEKHPQLKSGKFTQTHTHQKAKELWLQCTEEINQLVGPQKDWKSWRKCWQDARSKAKKKKSVINKHRNETGGGKPLPDEMTSIEERIVDLQSVIAVEGHRDTQESYVEWVSLDLLEDIQTPTTSDGGPVSEELAKHMMVTVETPVEVVLESPEGGPQQSSKSIPIAMKDSGGKRRFATSRLTSSVLETQKFNEQMNTKLTMKQNYYTAKLDIKNKN